MRGTLRVERRPGVAVATIDHPPINLLDAALRADLDAFSREMAEDEGVRVVRTIVEERTTRRLRAALGAGAQTRAGELDLEGLWAVLQDADTEPRETLAEPEAR